MGANRLSGSLLFRVLGLWLLQAQQMVTEFEDREEVRIGALDSHAGS